MEKSTKAKRQKAERKKYGIDFLNGKESFKFQRSNLKTKNRSPEKALRKISYGKRKKMKKWIK